MISALPPKAAAVLAVIALNRSSAILRMPASKVRTVPRSSTRSGMTFHASDSVRNEVTETTTDWIGSALREAMVCRAVTIWQAITVVSTDMCGCAAWPPLPVTWTVKLSVAA